jgi:type IV pilus assembly protein PilO
MNVDDINWDFNEAGEWPAQIKVGACLLVAIIICLMWVYADTQEQRERLEVVEKQELTLKKTYETKQRKAASLDAYKQQLKDIEERFGTMLQQLPNKTEIPELLIDVSQAGLASGLEFNLFQPSNEKNKGFYREKPINIVVIGSYHEFGEFVSNLAALPRIVTIHNVSLTGAGERMRMKMQAKTYRYVEQGK